MNYAMAITGTLIQHLRHNTQEINEENSWKSAEIIILKKRNRNSFEQIISRKQLKYTAKPVSITNLRTYTFEGLEEELNDAIVNARIKKIVKSSPIFIVKVNNFQLLFQILEEIAIDDYKIKIMSKLKSSPKSPLLMST